MHIRKILIKKTGLPLLAIFIIFGLFFQHQTADAFAFLAALPLVGQIVNSALQGMKDALTWVDKTIIPLLVWTAALSALSSVFLTVAAAFLDFTSNLPIKLDNSLVTAGWNFTSGLVNSIFILIFIFIVLAYIFNKTNYEIKKTLPRLIIIALVLNFSMLFVKIFLDFGWIVQNSIRDTFFGDHNLALEVMAPLKVWLLNVHSKIFGQLVAYVLSGLIPGGLVVKGIRVFTVVLGEGMFGTFSQAFTLIAFGFVGGLTFFVYGIFFLARIIVIYLLTMAAPLALAAYILPSTQKYFHQWFNALLQWTFSGSVVFLLMGLGLKLYTTVAPATVLAGFFNDGYLKFIFLLIYLWIVLIYSKKLLPKGMEAVWKATEVAMGAGIAATSVGGWAAGKAVGAGVGAGVERAKAAYSVVRGMGRPTHVALGEAARQGWGVAKTTIGSTIGSGSAVKKGVLKALGSMGSKAKAEAISGLGGKNLPFGIKIGQQKGLRKKPCPACGFGSGPGEKIAANADKCPKCSHVF